jgi:hypothetical protein
MSMRAFKFRGAEEPAFTADILQNNRLYCAKWHELNDPMEGTYDTLVVEPSKRTAALRSIREKKLRLRVCSLSETYKSHAMWAYYASGFKGVVIELEFPNGALTPVDYASGGRIQTWARNTDSSTLARDILTKKHSDWERERELRLLAECQFHDLAPGAIKRVILGSRIPADFEQVIRACAGEIPVQNLRIRSGRLKAA